MFGRRARRVSKSTWEFIAFVSSEPHEDASDEHHRFHQEARLEKLTVVASLHSPTSARWDHRLRALRFDLHDDRIRVLGLVREDPCAPRIFEELGCLRHVVDLSFGEFDLRRVPMTVHDDMYLG